jgi:hypothetical protein
VQRDAEKSANVGKQYQWGGSMKKVVAQVTKTESDDVVHWKNENEMQPQNST